MKKLLVVTAAALCLLGSSASADHINDHLNSDPEWPVAFPTREFFSGGAAFVTAIGPFAGWEVTNAVFDITWVSDGTTPASELAIDVGVRTEAGYVEIHVTGADLGFGSGPGTFTGTYSTHGLDGIYQGGFFGPNSTLDIALGAVNGGIEGTGYFVDSYINLDVIPNGPVLDVIGQCPGDMTFAVTNATPGSDVALLYALETGSFVIPGGPCAGTQLGLGSSVKIGAMAVADADGKASWTLEVPSAACRRLSIQAVDAGTCRTSNLGSLR